MTMRRPSRRLAPFLLASLAPLAALALASPAIAAPTAVASSVRESLGDEARSKFDEGGRLFKESRFAQARDAFLAAYATSGEPRVLYNVAVCDKALGRYARAILTLRKSLAATDRPLPADYTQRAAETIATLSRYVAFVPVEANVEGATITVDGEPLRENPMPMETGPHTVVATKEGYEPVTRQVDIVAGDAQAVRLELDAATTPGLAKVTCLGVARCEVRVGEETLGTAPVAFSRSPGSYLVRAFVDGRPWSEQRVDVQNGRTVEIALVGGRLPMARLRVTTERADDAIVVDGKKVGASGTEVELPPGEHRLLITRDGGATKSLDLLLRDNETRDVRVTLDEKKGISPWWFVAGGAVLAGAATTAIVLATRPTKFEGNSAGTLPPNVVPAFSGGGFR
jgi:PEGA domain